jgi:hypothetical protein
MEIREIVKALRETQAKVETCLDQSGDKWQNDEKLALESVSVDLSALLDRLAP